MVANSRMWATALSILPLVCAFPSSKAKRDSVTANVYLSNNTGTPVHYASGFIYGIPDTKDQIPDHFYDDIDFQYGRAGGAQVPSPGRGWIWGLTEYENRFASALSNYQTTREHGGEFIFLIHDLWGADGTQNSSAPYPGDDGDWTSWDEYLDRWISDMNDNDATEGLVVDIWNEPDLSYFWTAGQEQYLQMWGRTYYRLREAWPDVLLSGPSFANPPTNGAWWDAYMSFVSSNSSVPDQWSWHMETGSNNMLAEHGQLHAYLEEYDLPEKQININEYATVAEQVPAGAAWYISQLERQNAYGLRGNWQSGWPLHDYFANLLGKPNAGTSSYSATATGYYPNGEYQVYKYYALNMTGNRVGTLPSSDTWLDAYATVGTDMARVLVGVRPEGGEGTWTLTINDLSTIGLAESGSVDIHTWGFTYPGQYDEVDAPTDLGTVSHDYSGNVVSFPIYNTDTVRAYAFEISVA